MSLKVCFYLGTVIRPMSTTESSSGENTCTDEPSSKKAKVDVPVAETFEVPGALRNGKVIFANKHLKLTIKLIVEN